jgi:hypothetical protein
MNKVEKTALVLGSFMLVTLLVGGIIIFSIPTTPKITNFDQCVAAGNPILESYPEQCKTKSGQSFTKQITQSVQEPTVAPTTQTYASPTNTAKPQAIQIKTYTAKNFTFKYPSNWSPKNNPLEPGASKEVINLGIPDIQSDQTISFYSLPFEQIKPDDVIEESNITISGQPAKKWVRHGEGYFSFAYYTKDPDSEGSFGLHVTTHDRDLELEKQLDQLVTSLQFKKSQ